jgi:hypothetical protein
VKKYFLWKVTFSYTSRDCPPNGIVSERTCFAEVFISTKREAIVDVEKAVTPAMWMLASGCHGARLNSISKIELVGPVYVDLPDL